MGLLSGHYTPQIQEDMVRLGVQISFEHTKDEVRRFRKTEVSEATVRRTTWKYGKAGEAKEREWVEKLEGEAPEPDAKPEDLLLSVDGAFVALTTGEWREVKTVAIGEIVRESGKEGVVKTEKLSYFSRSYPAREFERYALAETHRRGVEKAKRVAAVNDGAEWIQGFISYHRHDAIRILDFAHAQSYLATAGKAVLGESTEAFQTWYAQASHQLKHESPETVFALLQSLREQAVNAKQNEVIETLDLSLNYLRKRQTMLHYADFRAQGLPLGSGSVESSHKLILQSRMKQAGMRWAPHHVDPMLALRNFIVDQRWDECWLETITYQKEQRRQQRRLDRAASTQTTAPSSPSSSPPLPQFETATPSTPLHNQQPPKEKTPWRLPPDHPWRKPFLNPRSSAQHQNN